MNLSHIIVNTTAKCQVPSADNDNVGEEEDKDVDDDDVGEEEDGDNS